MNPIVIAGSGNSSLAAALAEKLGIPLGRSLLSRFPDTELYAEIQDTVRGGDIYIVQPTGPPVDAHLMELLFLADACRRAGAARLTGIIPYFGYARQDRRTRGREAIGGRLIADLLRTGGLTRIVSVDLHTVSLEGFFHMPLEHLSAVPLLANALEGLLTGRSVIVSPDLGAARLAEQYAGLLHRPLAIVNKTRLSGQDVTVTEIVGEVAGFAPVIVDDMISTGGTIEAAANALLAAGCVQDITVVASHALLVGSAISRLSALSLKRILVTDSLPQTEHESLPLQVVSLAPMLAETVARLSGDESLNKLLSHR